MIIFKNGNLFDSECQTLVNTVNCYGVMGKGIALQFKQRYPDMFNEYKLACKNSELSSGGDIWIYDYVDMYKPKKILCFATKVMWQYPSRIEWIERGLQVFFNNFCHIKQQARVTAKNLNFDRGFPHFTPYPSV